MEHLALNIGSSSKKYTFQTRDGVLVRKVAVRRHEGYFWEEREGERYPMREEDYRVAGLHFISELVRRDDVSHDPSTWSASIRVVVPGTYYRTHRRVDADFIAQLSKDRLRDVVHIDPLVTELSVFQEAFPALTLVAVSDSAFHATRHENRIALPERWCGEYDLARFGFHGLVLQSIVRQRRDAGTLPGRMVVCHLGSGSSVSALSCGESVMSSMGYSPLEGVPMSTRSGDVPLGALLEVLRHLPHAEVVETLYRESGLRALSGYSDDMEVLVRDCATRAEARSALDSYTLSVASWVARGAVALGGLDLIVFSGGIGERSRYVREAVCAQLAVLGVLLDAARNEVGERGASLAQPGSSVDVCIMHPDEEREMLECAQGVLEHR